jgi:asparagine synthase (glutamine-hydrolysing)
VTVALSGDGADELFAGYDKYLGEVWRAAWARVPQGLRRGVLEPAIRALPASRASRIGEAGRKARRFVDGLAADPVERHEGWMRFAPPEDVSRLLGDERVTNPGLEVVRGVFADYDAHGLADPVNRMLFADLRLALPTDMLLKVDLASMLNSLEVRVPFLDYRIVELAMSMPGEWKMAGTARKRVLKDAAGDLLPPRIRRRRKAGFDVPVGEWLKSELRELFWDTVSSRGAIVLDRKLLERWYEEHCRGRADRTKVLWAALTLCWWGARVRRPAASSPAAVSAEQACAR